MESCEGQHIVVKHLVMWRLQEGQRAAQIATSLPLRAIVDGLRVRIAGLRELEIESSSCGDDDAVHLVLYSVFDGWDALRAYEAHPLHDDLKNFIRPLRVERRVADYEMPDR
jgi:hypothetical protein